MDQPEWNCKIDEGSSRLIGCYWSADSRHILTMSDFHLRLTLWSLVNKTVSYIKYPKLTRGGLEFSPDGQYMALAERRECKDYISVFNAEKWSLLHHFPLNTKDLIGLSWSPNGSIICTWDSCLYYQLFLYTLDGRRVASYTPYSEPHHYSLGLRSVCWSPSGQFLAIGGYDQKLRLLNHMTWKTIAELDHPGIIESQVGVAIYREVEKQVGPVDPPTFDAFGYLVGTHSAGIDHDQTFTQGHYGAINMHPCIEITAFNLNVRNLISKPIQGSFVATPTDEI